MAFWQDICNVGSMIRHRTGQLANNMVGNYDQADRHARAADDEKKDLDDRHVGPHDLRISKMCVGDHVYVWKNAGTWAHHGIVVLNDQHDCEPDCDHSGGCIVIAEKTAKDKGAVGLVTFREFVSDGHIQKYTYGDWTAAVGRGGVGTVYNLAEEGRRGRLRAALRAVKQVGPSAYNLIFRNCEHFAIWCKTGEVPLLDKDQVRELGCPLGAARDAAKAATREYGGPKRNAMRMQYTIISWLEDEIGERSAAEEAEDERMNPWAGRNPILTELTGAT